VWKSLFLGSSAQEDLAFMVPIRHDGAGESEEMSSKMEITITPPGWISYIGAMLGSVLALY
jgi:hypothetical protein